MQDGRFLGRLVRGDVGESFLTPEKVIDMVARNLPVRALLALSGRTPWLLTGVGAGVLPATRPRSRTDRTITVIALVFHSMPLFLVGQQLLFFKFFQLYLAGTDCFRPAPTSHSPTASLSGRAS